MGKKIEKQQIKKNIALSVTAQIISLLVGCVLYLVVPKCISQLDYAYWQTFVLYANYATIANFGLLDGMMLRYASFDYYELDQPLVRSQFLSLLFMNGFVSMCMIGTTFFIVNDITVTIVCVLAFSVIAKNIFAYTSYTFQFTNRIDKYAIVTIVQRVAFGLIFIILLLFGIKNYIWFCITDVICDLIASAIGFAYNKNIYFGKIPKLGIVLAETKRNMSAGIMLLVANLSGSFLVGGARMVVQWHWPPLTFGKVSFAISIAYLFLIFISAISIVLFPSLKRMDQKQLPQIYSAIRRAFSPIMFLILLLYYPGCWILNLWLPAYSESLTFLGVLLPFIVFASKVNLLSNNYLKAYRKEKQMCRINVFSVALSMLMFCIFAFCFNSITCLMISLVVVAMTQSIISEIVVMKELNLLYYREMFVESIVTILFIMFNYFFELPVAGTLYGVVIILYMLPYYSDIKKIILGRVKNNNV